MNNILYFYQIIISLFAIFLIFNKKSYIWFDCQVNKFLNFIFFIWLIQALLLLLKVGFIYHFSLLLVFSLILFYFIYFFVGDFFGHTYRVCFSYNKSAMHIIAGRRWFFIVFVGMHALAIFLSYSFISSFLFFLLSNLLLTIIAFYVQLNYFYIYQLLLFLNLSVFIVVILILGRLLGFFFDNTVIELFSLLCLSSFYYLIYYKLNLFIQKFYYRPDKNYNIVLKNFLRTMLSSRDLQYLCDHVCKLIYDQFDVEYVQLFLFNTHHSSYISFSNFGGSSSKADFIDDDFVRFLESHIGIVHASIFNREKIDRMLKEHNIKLIMPLMFNSSLLGFINIGPKRKGLDFISADKLFLESIRYYTAITVSNLLRYNALKRSYWNSIRALSNAIDAKDQYTKGHSERVVYYSVIVGEEMGLSAKELEHLKFGGILHDVGKIAIDDAIIKKPAGLTDIERSIIRNHPLEGNKILLPITFLKDIRKIVKHHHERWDGKGYPDGLCGKEIPLLSRIVQVVDTFDAITSSRAYRGRQDVKFAIHEIQRCSGTQFDPLIVYYLVQLYDKGLITKINFDNLDFDNLGR
ncbi:MAG: HD-GYP domain-containing protein [bacterium]|nr:HD-GYP domain-containing protein [bacterium]